MLETYGFILLFCHLLTADFAFCKLKCVNTAVQFVFYNVLLTLYFFASLSSHSEKHSK